MKKGYKRGAPEGRPYTREEWAKIVEKNPGLLTVNDPPPPLDLDKLGENSPDSIEK